MGRWEELDRFAARHVSLTSRRRSTLRRRGTSDIGGGYTKCICTYTTTSYTSEDVDDYRTSFVEFLKRLVGTTLYAGSDDAAQNCSPRAGQSGWGVLVGLVPIGEPEPAGTQSLRWPQGRAGECHFPSEVRYRRLPAGGDDISTSVHTQRRHPDSPLPRTVSSLVLWHYDCGSVLSDHSPFPVAENISGVLCPGRSLRT